MSRSDLRAKIACGLPVPRQKFAQKLRELRGCVPRPPVAHDVIARLAAVGYVGLSPSSLSRYYSGKDVPGEGFVRAYYEVIVAAAGRWDLPCLLDELLDLRNSAEAADGRRNAGLGLRVRAFEQEGEAVRVAVGGKATPLPVPAGSGRPNEAGEEHEAAITAVRLMAAGDLQGALAVLESAVYRFSPEGLALCVKHFYALAQVELGQNLVMLVPRIRSLKEVVALSQALRADFPDVADQLLCMITAW
ncbi:hypothetical protein [Nocardia sp. NRRL S-836]|uniref:hypothetical protein n=1 Tax=Nocardia sp. NRRL S-836 TaxID=1519492 RepID=UPI000ADA5E34|nr:hypothetical protein [Nocardia sp. NRRL S-836]